MGEVKTMGKDRIALRKDSTIKVLNEIKKFSENEGSFPLSKKLEILSADLSDNLMIMVSGEFNAGKSTFINALLGEKVLTTDITPATAIITKLTYGEERKVIAHFIDGTIKSYELSWLEQLTAERKGAGESVRSQLSYIEYQLPFEILKSYTLIDSPGLTALHEHHTKVTESFMERADIGIWLFNSLSVGTASEVKWLKKMNSLNVPTYGVVNAVDLIEDEDLDSFLEFNKRRLFPLVKELYGVSARDILNGKLNNDEESIEWGNGQAIEELFDKFSPINLTKMDRFYNKLMNPLNELNQLVRDRKKSFNFTRNIQELKDFEVNTFKKYKDDSSDLQALQLEAEIAYKSWESFIQKNEGNEQFPEMFLEKLNNKIYFTENELVSLKSDIEKYTLIHMELKKKLDEIESNSRTLKSKWEKAGRYPFFGIRKKLVLEDEESHNFEIDIWNKKLRKYNEKVQILEEKIRIFNINANTAVNTEYQLLYRRYNKKNEELERFLSITKKQFNNVNDKRLFAFTQHIKNYNSIRGSLYKNLKTGLPTLSNLQSYKNIEKEVILFGKLYSEFDYRKFARDYNELNSYKKVEVPSRLQSSFKPLQWKIVNQVPLKELPHSKLDQRSEISKREQRLISRIIVFGLSVAALIYIISLSRDPANQEQVDGYSNPMMEIATTLEEDMSEAYDSENETGSVTTSSVDEEEYAGIEISEYTIESYLSTFRTDYEDALNQKDSTNISTYFTSGSGSYLELANFIDSIRESGFTYEFLEGNIISIEKDSPESYSAIIEETFSQYSDNGAESYNERTKRYKLNTTNPNNITISSIEVLDKVVEVVANPTVSEEAIRTFFMNYRADYETALNMEEFSYIASYYPSNSNVSDEIREFVNSIKGKGLDYKFTENEIISISEYGLNQYTLEIEEAFSLYGENGEESYNERLKEYDIKVEGDSTFIIEEIREISKINTIVSEGVEEGVEDEVEEINQRMVDLVSPVDIENMMRRYYSDLELAFNDYGFSYIEEYYATDGEEYQATKEYIAKAINENMNMTNQYLSIYKVEEYDDNHYVATLDFEDQYLYEEGNGDLKEARADYLIEVTSVGEMKIVKLLDLTILNKQEF